MPTESAALVGLAQVLTFGTLGVELALALLFGSPIPLLPVQLLWLNLVTNGIQDVALAFEPGTGDERKSPPRT